MSKELLLKDQKPYAMQSSRHFFDYSSWLMSIQFRYFGIFGQNEGHNPFGCFTLPWSWQKKVFSLGIFYLSFVLTKRPVAYSWERGLIFENKYLTMLQILSKCEVMKFDHLTATPILCEIKFWWIQTVQKCHF